MYFGAGGSGGFRRLTTSPGASPFQPGKGRTSSDSEDFPGELVALATEQDTESTGLARTRAREIAARLALPKPRRVARRRNASGRAITTAFSGGSDDIDLDATLEVLLEEPFPNDDAILVRERMRRSRAVAVLVDISGSMKGERVLNAAAIMGALLSELRDERLAVIAFWSDAAVLARLGERIDARVLVDQLVSIPAQGLTNIEFPLRLAWTELRNVPTRDARVVLLSDCVHNAGPDPLIAARAAPRLDVLVDASGEHDMDLARALAREGRGALGVLRDHRDAAPLLQRLFST